MSQGQVAHPERGRLIPQAPLDAVFQHLYCSLHLPIGLAIANGDVVVDNTLPFMEPYKAACKPGAIIYLNVVCLPQ